MFYLKINIFYAENPCFMSWPQLERVCSDPEHWGSGSNDALHPCSSGAQQGGPYSAGGWGRAGAASTFRTLMLILQWFFFFSTPADAQSKLLAFQPQILHWEQHLWARSVRSFGVKEAILSRGIPSVLLPGIHPHGHQSCARYVRWCGTQDFDLGSAAAPFGIPSSNQILWGLAGNQIWPYSALRRCPYRYFCHRFCSFVSSSRETCWENPPWVWLPL